jgi:hypothetical protein
VVQLFIAFVFMLFGYESWRSYAMAFPVQPGETDVPPLKRTGPRKGR